MKQGSLSPILVHSVGQDDVSMLNAVISPVRRMFLVIFKVHVDPNNHMYDKTTTKTSSEWMW